MPDTLWWLLLPWQASAYSCHRLHSSRKPLLALTCLLSWTDPTVLLPFLGPCLHCTHVGVSRLCPLPRPGSPGILNCLHARLLFPCRYPCVQPCPRQEHQPGPVPQGTPSPASRGHGGAGTRHILALSLSLHCVPAAWLSLLHTSASRILPTPGSAPGRPSSFQCLPPCRAPLPPGQTGQEQMGSQRS